MSSLHAVLALNMEYSDALQEQHDRGFSKIVEQARFTQSFILTYHGTVLGVILLLTALHITQKLNVKISRRSLCRTSLDSNKSHGYSRDSGIEDKSSKYNPDVHEAEDNSSASSGGSANELDYSRSVENRGTESTPLLNRSDASQEKSSYLGYIKAALMYQPSAVPVINRALPSNGISLFITCFLAVNVFYLLFNSPPNFKSPFAFADRAGMLFVSNLPLLGLLSAKNQPLKLFTGYSYESLNIFHRRLGEWLCLLALFHAAGMTMVWYVLLRPIGWSFAFYLSRRIILIGLFAFISYEMLYFTSLASFRRRWYELFLASHIILQTTALVLLWFHHHRTRPYVGLALFIFLVDRIIFRWIAKTRHQVATLTVLDSGTVKLSSSFSLISPRSRWLPLPLNVHHGWKATDHVFVTVPRLSRTHPIQAHPFTIASAAPSLIDNEAQLDLIIRAKDGFSRDLLQYAMLHKSVDVRFDGPYGSSHCLDMLLASQAALLVVGGSGIAVAYPLLQALLSQAFSACDEETALEQLPRRKLALIWVVREEPHRTWLGDDELTLWRKQGVDIISPRATAEAGRPDIGAMVRNWVDDNCKSRTEKIGLVCCGPDEMSRTVRNTCASMVRDGRDVNVEIEKFGW